MKKILFSLVAVALGGMTLMSCGSKATGEQTAEEAAAVDSAVLAGEGSTTFEQIKANLSSPDAKANLEALVNEIKENGLNYNAQQLVEAKQLLDELVEKAKAASVSVEDITKLTETASTVVSADLLEKAQNYVKSVVVGSEPVQAAADAAAAVGEQVEAGKAAADVVVEEGKAKVDEAKAKVDAAKAKVEETKKNVETVKKNMEATGEAMKNLMGK